MPPTLALFAALLGIVWLLWRDAGWRDGISSALWIPMLWVGRISSRPISAWLGFGGAQDALEGSPVERVFFFALIFSALIVLSRRNLIWSRVISKNWPVFLYYSYLLLSVLWADPTSVAFKRWLKESGNIVVALVILTEENPQQAIRAVFVRCAYVLMPLSIVLIKYYPAIGRRFSRAGGTELIGASDQKNTLGAMVLVCGLILLWDWIERPQPMSGQTKRLERYVPLGCLGVGLWLLHMCDSKTSIVCLAVGSGLSLAARSPLFRRRLWLLAPFTLMAGIGYFAFDWTFGIRESVMQGLGRNPNLTGRTEIWQELFALKTDPLFGAGFLSLWSDPHYQGMLPDWARVGSAHNGYLETYLDGGMIGVFFLAVMLVAAVFRTAFRLAGGGSFEVLRFAAVLATLISNYSESHFARMSPVVFLFLLSAMECPAAATADEPFPNRQSVRGPGTSDFSFERLG